MKIAITTNMTPFIRGGAEELADSLVQRLEAEGHETDFIRIPFRWDNYLQIPQQMAMAQQINLNQADRVISLKFPAYLIRHRHHTIWLLHQFRQAYDLADEPVNPFPQTFAANSVKNHIHHEDRLAFAAAKKIFTISPIVQARLAQYNNVDSETLYCPPFDPEIFTGGEPQGYIFAGGRINPGKRQELLVRALALTPKTVKLIIAGPADTFETENSLRTLARELNVEDRLSLEIGFLPRQRVAELINGSIACAYIPINEDGQGYVTDEAALAAKPVIAAADSGGVLELVSHKTTGWVLNPEKDLIAESFVDAFANPEKTKQLGLQLRQRFNDLNMNWDTVLERLLE